MTPILTIEKLPEPYSLERAWAVTYGISHLAYGETPQSAWDSFTQRFSI